jgi:hypothetical protein
MTTQEMQNKINERIQDLVKAGAVTQLENKGLNKEQIKEQLYIEAVCTLLGV